jgi:1-acyl-sn-glycerol-3-phosphate acyltransferase
MISFFRTIITIVVAIVMTMILATVVVVAAMFGLRHHEGGIFDSIPRFWSRSLLWAAGVKVRLHGLDRLVPGQSYIFAANHVSLFDIPALVGALPQHYFVAKSELFKVPFFGAGIRAVGTIPIQRDNRKSAFGSYDVAAERIKGGSSVVVFPEGTRGTSRKGHLFWPSRRARQSFPV